MRLLHFRLSTATHWLNCDPFFRRQALDLVHVSDLGLATGAHWLNCELSFSRQAADLVRVSDLGLPIGSIVTLFYVRRLRTCCVYLIIGFSGAPAGPTLALYGDPLAQS